jgi:hypothetical protein
MDVYRFQIYRQRRVEGEIRPLEALSRLPVRLAIPTLINFLCQGQQFCSERLLVGRCHPVLRSRPHEKNMLRLIRRLRLYRVAER